MKLACAVVGVSALFVAVPTLAETCDRPVVVTGGQVAMSSHPTADSGMKDCRHDCGCAHR